MKTTRKQRRLYKFNCRKYMWKCERFYLKLWENPETKKLINDHWERIKIQVALNTMSSIPLGGKSLLDYGTVIDE